MENHVVAPCSGATLLVGCDGYFPIRGRIVGRLAPLLRRPLLGHTSAEMSLRYGRLFDATVRADYERALTQAKQRLGPVLPDAPTAEVARCARAAA
jgi:hypothetical protein